MSDGTRLENSGYGGWKRAYKYPSMWAMDQALPAWESWVKSGVRPRDPLKLKVVKPLVMSAEERIEFEAWRAARAAVKN
jgi:hypothetical protein